jgi:hypothetical protein
MVRPGLRVLRRDLRTLQFGLDWPGLSVIHETPAVRAVLAAVDGFRDARGVVLAAASQGPPPEACEEALRHLLEAGVLVDQASGAARGVDDDVWAGLSLLAGPDRHAGDLLRSQRETQVLVEGGGRVAARVGEILGQTAVRVAADAEHATLVVAAYDAEPDRVLSDQAMRRALPHLWVHLRDITGMVGPFVLPGRTACLRCVDAARTDRDPTWPTVLESYLVRAPDAAPVAAGVLETMVAAWAVQEVLAFVSRIRPETLDCVVEVPYGVGRPRQQRYETHPECGCGWPVWQDTMGA